MRSYSYLLLTLYLLLSLFLAFVIYLNLNGLRISGHNSNHIIAISWLLASVFMVIRFWKQLVTKVLVAVSMMLIILSILPLGIPFYHMLQFTFGVGHHERFELSEEYTVECNDIVLWGSIIQIYERKGMLEELVVHDWNDLMEALVEREDSLAGIRYTRDESAVQAAELVSVTEDSITVNYSLLGREVVYTHSCLER